MFTVSNLSVQEACEACQSYKFHIEAYPFKQPAPPWHLSVQEVLP